MVAPFIKNPSLWKKWLYPLGVLLPQDGDPLTQQAVFQYNLAQRRHLVEAANLWGQGAALLLGAHYLGICLAWPTGPLLIIGALGALGVFYALGIAVVAWGLGALNPSNP